MVIESQRSTLLIQKPQSILTTPLQPIYTDPFQTYPHITFLFLQCTALQAIYTLKYKIC